MSGFLEKGCRESYLEAETPPGAGNKEEAPKLGKGLEFRLQRLRVEASVA